METVPGAEAIPSASAASAETSLNISTDTDSSVPDNTDEYLDDNNFQRDRNLSPYHLAPDVPNCGNTYEAARSAEGASANNPNNV